MLNLIKERVHNFLYGLKAYILFFSIICTFIDSFFIKGSYDFVVLFIFISWLLTIYFYSFNERTIITIILTFFCLLSFFYIIGLKDISQKTSVWAFVFLCIYAVKKLFT